MDTRRALFLGILALALIHGMLYLFLVPPWEHYDEPTHFEYGWLIANRGRLPQKGDQDLVLRHEISASMLEEGFQHEHAIHPALLPGEGRARIGITELVHPPLYYLLIAVPLRLARHADVRTQLTVARGVSLLLYLVTVACAWGVGEELAQRGTEKTSASLCVPFFSLILVLLPGFVDMMTAVNSDAGAVATFSVFLWSAARAIRRREKNKAVIGALVGCTLAALLCPITKNTAAVALPLLPLVWVLALVPPLRRLRRGPTRIRLAITCVLIAGAGLGLLFSWGNAARWTHSGTQPTLTRQKLPQAPLGESALVLEEASGHLRQFVPQSDVERLRGHVVSLGTWIWSPEPVGVQAPIVGGDLEESPAHSEIQVGHQPTFYALTTTVSSEANTLHVTLFSTPPGEPPHPPVYYDGIVLAEGDHTPASGPASEPQFDDPGGTAGTWSGQRFENLARNGSAERATLFVRAPIERVLQRYARRSPSQWLDSLLDWERSAGLYPIVAQQMLQTFWARFSWNHIPLPEPWYGVLGAVSLFCLVGAVVGTWNLGRTPASAGDAAATQRRGTGLRRTLFLFGLSGAVIWTNAVLRFHPIQTKVFVPVARYAYPAILPTVLVLVGGTWTLTRKRLRWLRLSLLCGAVVLAGVSLWTVAAYPRYDTPPQALPLLLLILCVPTGWALESSETAMRAGRPIRHLWQHLQTWWAQQDKERLLAYTALVLILLAALATRAWYSTLGLPYMHVWDEPQITHTALQMLKSGDLNPHFFSYGSLLIYANLGVDALHYLYKLAQPIEADVLRGLGEIEMGPLGPWPATGDYRWFLSHPSFLLWNRWVTVLLGVGSVVAAFALARQIGGLWAGVIAAAFLAGQPFYAMDLNSLALTDGPSAALLILACVLAATYIRHQRPVHLIGAAAAVGLAASIKYNSAYGLVVPLTAAIIVRVANGHRPPWWLWPAIPAASALAFILGTPYALLDMPAFLRAVGSEVQHYAVQGHDAYGKTILPGQPHLTFQLLQLIRHLGLAGTLLALAGLPKMARHKVGWLLFVLGSVALWFLSRSTVRFERNYAVLYPLLAVAQGCGLAWFCARLSSRPLARPWARVARAGMLLLVAVAGVLYLSSALRTSLATKNKVETRTQAIHEVNAMAQRLELEQATVGIASELQVHPLDLRQVDTELLYRLEPVEDLICQPGRHDLLVLPGDDGTTLVQQAVRTLSQDDVPHVELKGAVLLQQAPIVEPGILVAAPLSEYEPPDDCAPHQRSEGDEWPPAPLTIGDWEAPIPDRHRPDETPAKPWRAVPTCADILGWRIGQDRTAEYSRLQERGTKMQIALRGSVQTAPCTLAPGTYRLRWQARAGGDRSKHALLQVSVWEHPPARAPRRIHTRVLRIGQGWAKHYELVRVTRNIPLSIEMLWLDGPGAPHLEQDQPSTALVLEPKVRLVTEPTPSLSKALAGAWENTVRRLAGE